MARAKSPSGGKSNRTSKEQTSANTASGVADSNAVAAQAEPVKAEARINAEPKKLELLKTEPRNNVVPINLDDEIRRRAYELFQQRGPGSGGEAEDWLAAEREVMKRYHQQSA
ncbi:MAG: DUF2934 domain-containing protein [Candidatus Sulfotelmatobacter sp.]